MYGYFMVFNNLVAVHYSQTKQDDAREKLIELGKLKAKHFFARGAWVLNRPTTA